MRVLFDVYDVLTLIALNEREENDFVNQKRFQNFVEIDDTLCYTRNLQLITFNGLLTGFTSIFCIRIDFDKQSVLLAEEIIEIQEHLGR